MPSRTKKKRRSRAYIQKGGLSEEEQRSWRLRIRLLVARAVVRSAYAGARFAGIEDPDALMVRLMTEGAMNAAGDARLAAAAGGRIASQLFASGTYITNEAWIALVYMLGQLGGIGTSAMRQIIDNTPAALRGADNTVGLSVLAVVLYAWISGATGDDIVSMVERGIGGTESKAAAAASSTATWGRSVSDAIRRLARGSADRGREISRFVGLVVSSIGTEVCGPALGAPLGLAMSAAPHVATVRTVMGRIEDSVLRLVERVEGMGGGGEVAAQLVTAMVQVLSTGDIGSLFRASERAFRLVVSSLASGGEALRAALQSCGAASSGAASSAAASCASVPGLFAQFVRNSWRTFRTGIDVEADKLDLGSRLRAEMEAARARDEAIRARDAQYWGMVLERMNLEEREAMDALHQLVAEMRALDEAANLAARGDDDYRQDLRAVIESQLGDPSEDAASRRGPASAAQARCERPDPGLATPTSADASQTMFSPGVFGSMDPSDLGRDNVAGMDHALYVEADAERRAEEDVRQAREHARELERARIVPPNYLPLAPHRAKRPREEDEDEDDNDPKKPRGSQGGGTRKGKRTRAGRGKRRRSRTRRRKRNGTRR
jgi:hypothetical protein